MTDHCANATSPINLDDIAHEVWAAAQLMPEEGLADGAERVKAVLVARSGAAFPTARGPSPAAIVEEKLRERIADLEACMDNAWRKIIAYPFSQVCKHLVAANMLSDMSRLGFEITPELADAVVNARDEEALAHRPIRARLNPEGS